MEETSTTPTGLAFHEGPGEVDVGRDGAPASVDLFLLGVDEQLLPDGRGGVVPAEVLHQVELAALADRFAVIAPDAAALTAAS